MLTKRSVIVGLVGLNLLLLAGLVLGSYSLPAAYAQAAGRAGEFLCVTCGVTGQDYDVLYVLDLPERKLHAFIPTIPSGKLEYATQRDLKKDFQR
ncbi:MAG: hypothetical protein IID36_05505 [Planctomycetes bacterium]|nr:hypothetical protein [Planctomycetota bacterium]